MSGTGTPAHERPATPEETLPHPWADPGPTAQPGPRGARPPAPFDAPPTTSFAARALAALRIATGFIFLWAFLDKTFGFGYATAADSSWAGGHSPAAGYLSGVAAGPLRDTFHSWAGETWVDLLYMGGLFALGVALVAGVGLRVTAVAGTAMMLMLWMSVWPPARELSDGTPSMSPNPLVDQHVVYAVAMVVLAACSAGRVWGLGRAWERTALVRRWPWLR